MPRRNSVGVQIFHDETKNKSRRLVNNGETQQSAGWPLAGGCGIFCRQFCWPDSCFSAAARPRRKVCFTTAGPGWHVQQGQALWRPKSGLPEFGGDLVLASDDAGRCLIQFDKTPMAILSAQTTTNQWLIKFPQRQMSFSGRGRADAL